VDHQSKNSRHFRKEVGILLVTEVHAKGKARSYVKLPFKSVVAFLAIKSTGTVHNVILSIIVANCL